MGISGIVLHDSVCPDLKRLGYDFFVCRDGTVLPSQKMRDDDHLHVYVEGDFSQPIENEPLVREQIFVLVKLVLRLASLFEFDPQQMMAHGDHCPGEQFPWHELKIRVAAPPH